jgi:hypothetical protein
MKKATSTDIETLRHILSTFSSNKSFIVETQCNKLVLTEEFVSEFKEHIDKKAFSNSPDLSLEMISKFPELFDAEVWKSNKAKSLEPLMDDKFAAKLSDVDLESAIKNSDPKKFTQDFFWKHEARISPGLREHIVNNTGFLNGSDDETIVRHADSLSQSVFFNRSVDIKWTNSLIESVLKNKRLLKASFVVASLSKSKDYAFIKRILEAQLTYTSTNETFDLELRNFISTMPEPYLGVLFSMLDKNNPNALTYSVLEHTLKMKDYLDEEFLMENVEHFKRNGLVGELATYARSHEYNSLLIMLKLA